MFKHQKIHTIMSVQLIPKSRQGRGAFNGGEIVENHPVGFPQNGGEGKPFSSLFYWAHARAVTDSTIGLHPHQGFEIMSFILKGRIRHFDTKLNAWKDLEAGDVQIIRAGSGISHAEFMAKDAEMFQIWFDPDLNKTLQQPPSYNDYRDADLPRKKAGNLHIKTYVGPGAPVAMDTPDLRIQMLDWATANESLPASPDRVYAIYVLEGSVAINDTTAHTHDFAIVSNASEIQLESPASGRVFMIDLPQKVPYQTYGEIMRARMMAR